MTLINRPLIMDTEVKHYDLRNALYNRIVQAADDVEIDKKLVNAYSTFIKTF